MQNVIEQEKTIAAGISHTCSILDDGSVACWGENFYGQLGDGGVSDRNAPSQTASLGSGRSAVSISSGYMSVCAMLRDGTVSRWGRNANGQL